MGDSDERGELSAKFTCINCVMLSLCASRDVSNDRKAALTAASQAWDAGQPDLARTNLTAALDLARALGYL